MARFGGGDTTGRASFSASGDLLPQQINAYSDWVAVASGSYHVIARRTDGSIWVWGGNYEGQLGDGTVDNKNTPQKILSNDNWVSMAGGNHSLAVRSDGTIWSWGENGNGQLGDGTLVNKNVPRQLSAGNSWTSLSAGTSHSIGIKSDGSLWAWGLNSDGQLGLGNTTSPITGALQVGADRNWAIISAGGSHSIGIKSDGSLWAWGLNSDGQLGLGNTTSR